MKKLKSLFFLSILISFSISCSGTKGNQSKITSNENHRAENSVVNKESDSENMAKDGSSIKNAIKVKSVSEEYQIVRKNCPNCKIKGQALLSEGNKHYDLLTLTNEKGEEVNYYFDISSFYGKW